MTVCFPFVGKICKRSNVIRICGKHDLVRIKLVLPHYCFVEECPEERRLFDLAQTCMEASIPSDLGWETNDIEDAWPADRLMFMDPSFFPEPENRK